MEKIVGFQFILVFVVALLSFEARARKQTASGCRGKSLAKYNVTFEALWSRETFPKQYPLFRPHAQWTKFLGRSHGRRYSLWSEGEVASLGVKQFVELGLSTILDMETQGQHQILDIFNIAAINAGIGSATSKLFVDSRHSRISMITHIVPSPDWFVGIDNLNLCKGDLWTPSLTVELYPYDAGTDQGFTFTAPNWAETPQKPISVITAHFPDHPANSFYYPDIDKLPPLGRLIFHKETSYKYIEGRLEPRDEEGEDDSGEVVGEISEEAAGKDVQLPPASPGSYEELLRPFDEGIVRESEEELSPLPKGRKENGRRKNKNRNRNRNKNKSTPAPAPPNGFPRGPVDCEVSEWAEWSACSKTCGFGTRTRRRVINRRPMNYGRPCPLLMEDELCGSMRSCGWTHFNRFGSPANSRVSVRSWRSQFGGARDRTSARQSNIRRN